MKTRKIKDIEMIFILINIHIHIIRVFITFNKKIFAKKYFLITYNVTYNYPINTHRIFS